MLFLSNTTPNATGTGIGGNGTYRLHAVATSVEGYQVELGTRTITIDNAHSSGPFGTIDTPAQGDQNVHGSQYVNFGWVLTPQPYSIPLDGSTINVVVDGNFAGHPVYGFPRADIDALFPGYQNTGKAVGYFNLDTTHLTNGLHSIAWGVRDTSGAVQGIGSRVFYVNNPGGPAPAQSAPTDLAASQLWRSGHDPDAPFAPYDGSALRLAPGDRLELRTGRHLAEQQHLPPGASIAGDTFFWQVPIMAKGEFRISLRTADGDPFPVTIRIGAEGRSKSF